VFKTATDIAGDSAIISGAILASQQHRNSAADEVGAGLIVAGLLSKVVSATTTPQADVRSWENLPQYISFASLSLSPGVHHLTVNFLDGAGQPLPNLAKNLTVNMDGSERDKVLFISDQSVTPQIL